MDNLEREQNAEANAFAIALLMPQSLVLAELDALLERKVCDSEQELVRRMAKKFEVSESMMNGRIVQLGRMISL